VTATRPLVLLHDLDLLLAEARDAEWVAKLRRAGLILGDVRALERARALEFERVEPRWRPHYERALRRYGSAVASVRGRVCHGCHMALPRSAFPGESDAVSLCESCGRILYWGRGESL